MIEMVHAAEPKWPEGRRHDADRTATGVTVDEITKKTEASFKVTPSRNTRPEQIRARAFDSP